MDFGIIIIFCFIGLFVCNLYRKRKIAGGLELNKNVSVLFWIFVIIAIILISMSH